MGRRQNHIPEDRARCAVHGLALAFDAPLGDCRRYEGQILVPFAVRLSRRPLWRTVGLISMDIWKDTLVNNPPTVADSSSRAPHRHDRHRHLFDGYDIDRMDTTSTQRVLIVNVLPQEYHAGHPDAGILEGGLRMRQALFDGFSMEPDSEIRTHIGIRRGLPVYGSFALLMLTLCALRMRIAPCALSFEGYTNRSER